MSDAQPTPIGRHEQRVYEIVARLRDGEPLPDRYEGGIDLRDDKGNPDSSVRLDGRFGRVHMTSSINCAQRGWGSVLVDLSPEECEELAGALKDAARAARTARRNT